MVAEKNVAAKKFHNFITGDDRLDKGHLYKYRQYIFGKQNVTMKFFRSEHLHT